MAKLRWRSVNSARRRIPSRGSHFTSYPIPDKNYIADGMESWL